MATVTNTGGGVYQVALTTAERAVLATFTADHGTTVEAMFELMLNNWAAQNWERAVTWLRQQLADTLAGGSTPSDTQKAVLVALLAVRPRRDMGGLESAR